MAWITQTAGGAGTSGVNYKLVSKDANIVTIRDEYIKTGYNLTEKVTDEETGEEHEVTTFHQTGVIRVQCRVVETVKVEEWNALTEAAASLVAGTGLNTAMSGVTLSDNRTVGTWRVGMAFVEVPNCIGTVVRVSARRSNEANGWTVTKTTTTTTKA